VPAAERVGELAAGVCVGNIIGPGDAQVALTSAAQQQVQAAYSSPRLVPNCYER
jgi:hypothetical protein